MSGSRHVEPHQAVADVEQGGHRPAQHQELAAHFVDPPDVLAARGLLEHLALEGVDLGLERVDDREVVVDHEIHQRIEHEARADAEHRGRALAARADVGVGQGRAVADGDDVAPAGEDVGLAVLDLAGLPLRGAQHDEQGIAVDLELGALMRVVGVLDREVVQPEPALHPAQQLLARLVQAEPDEAVGARVIAARDEVEGGRGIVLDVDVGDPAPALVGGTVDDHAHRPALQPAAPARRAGTVARGGDRGNRSVAWSAQG